MSDDIKQPSHYALTGMEVMDVLKAAGLFENFAKGNIIKYTLRAGKKPGISAEQDIRKTVEYATQLADWLAEHGEK